MMQFECYLYDLRREAQNELLGHLFPHRLAPRQPTDADLKVLTLGDSEELIRYFENETEWARTGRGSG